MGDYVSVVSAYFLLEKQASLWHHPKNVGKEKAMCTKQVELAQYHFAMVTPNCMRNIGVSSKGLLAYRKQLDEKSTKGRCGS